LPSPYRLCRHVATFFWIAQARHAWIKIGMLCEIHPAMSFIEVMASKLRADERLPS
jgi:hypothetical protein